jgi:hypothetical protein
MTMTMRMPIAGLRFLFCDGMGSGMQTAFNCGSDGLVYQAAIEDLASKEKEGNGHCDEWE